MLYITYLLADDAKLATGFKSILTILTIRKKAYIFFAIR